MGSQFPDFPDSPTPGGEGGGGDHVPYIDLTELRKHELGIPVIEHAGSSNGYVRFSFSSTGPIMRYEIEWSRPGRQETDMRWVDPAVFSASEEYIVNEHPVPDTTYVFRVKAVGRERKLHFNGPYEPYTEEYPETTFVESTFHTPPLRILESDSATEVTRRGPGLGPAATLFGQEVDEATRVSPHLITDP
jgi:hypothetical protein